MKRLRVGQNANGDLKLFPIIIVFAAIFVFGTGVANADLTSNPPSILAEEPAGTWISKKDLNGDLSFSAHDYIPDNDYAGDIIYGNQSETYTGFDFTPIGA